MTGTLISRASLLTFVSAAIVGAAEVETIGDGRLTGELVAMDLEGVITLVTPVSEKPLKLKSDRVSTVDFGMENNPGQVPDQRIRLINGDVLPASIEYLDDNTLRAKSPYLGNIDIPRSVVDSVQLGIAPQKLVFGESEDFEGWQRGSRDSRDWKIENGNLSVSGQGEISRKIDLPEKFVIRFDLIWNNNPNFRFTFADPLEGKSERVDRYFLQFGAAGLEIKRESTGENRYTPILMLSRRPDQFAGNRLKIEIRVDRTRGRLHLYLNDELEGRYTDPVPNIPRGSGISLASRAPSETEQTVEDLEVLVWDDRGDRHRAEARGDGKKDAIIGRYGERFGGRLISINDGEEGKVFLFKSDFQNEPLALPEVEVSTVFFGGGSEKSTVDEFEGLVLLLSGQGEIRVDECEFGKETVTARHPLLGEIEIKRSGVTFLERRKVPKAKPVKKK